MHRSIQVLRIWQLIHAFLKIAAGVINALRIRRSASPKFLVRATFVSGISLAVHNHQYADFHAQFVITVC